VIGYLYKYVAKSEKRKKGENKLKIILYNKTTSISWWFVVNNHKNQI
jgi:hypothetical protein